MMKTIVVAVISGFLGGVLAAWLLSQRVNQEIARWNDAEMSRSADFTIILNRDGSNQCFSSTTPSGQARRGQQVSWNIHDMGRCLASGDQLEIRFKNETSDDPLDLRRPKHQRRIRARVKGDVEPRPYLYDVWLITQAGGETRLEDPELDIVP